MQHSMNINPESELGRQLKVAAAQKKPLRLVSGGMIYDVQVRAHGVAPVSGGRHDPGEVRQGLAWSAGALRGVDLAALKRELRGAREQDSFGRPA